MTLETTPALRLPTPAILREQVVVEEHDLARDGSFAVVTRRVVAGDDYISHLFVVGVRDAGEPRPLTDGLVRDMRPAVSPDGTRVAFTRKVPGESRTHLLIAPVDGSTPPGQLDLGQLDPGQPVWSPDGRWLAFAAETGDERFIVGARPAKGEPLARLVTALDYRADEVGYVDRRSQLFIVAADGSGAPRQLTDIANGVSGVPAWRPDGRAIAFTADPRPDADRRPRTSIFEAPVEVDAVVGSDERGPSEPREVLALAGPVRAPAYSPDGRHIAGIGVDDPDFFDDLSPTLFAGPVDGTAAPWPLFADLDRPVGNWADSDLTGWMADQRPGPVWADPGQVMALVTDRGRTHPWRIRVDPVKARPAGNPERLAGGDAMANMLACAHDGTATVISTIGTRPPELCAVDDGRLRPLTTFGGAWLDGVAWPSMRHVEAPGPGGPIEAWVASPAGSGDQPLPTIVDVHGGPLGAWAPAPSLEVALLCARGYRVLLPNIRGSASYGREWIEPQLGDWGGVDAADVHAALDHVIALGLADPDRLGALGLSYGGFMVNWLVGTTDRFRAAVSENGVTNQVSAWAASDTGPEYCRASHLGDPMTPEGVEKLWRQSPLRHVAAIRTPLLLLQSEADRRCPASDNEQLFVALRQLGRTVEYVLYPEEYHVVQATGRIDRRVDRMQRMLDWFDRFVRA